MFVDKVKVTIHAGDGGNGIISFRKEKFVDRGGPDGGDGGDGGDVVLEASSNQDSLAAFRYKKLLAAEPGQPGSKARKHGKSGQDLVVAVPVGTVVYDEEGQILADLSSNGQQEAIAKGGKGGYGNAHFVSSRRQAPRLAEKGEKGRKIEAIFELKMLADVGLVGLPNAGKSTLLASISHAKPEIANYAFTTLHPNLGVVDLSKNTSLLIADIPGLIEGASKGKGLGDEFLRHVERTSVLIHLIDVYEDVAKAYETIQNELKAYQIDLIKKPQLVALNKVDGFDKKQLAVKIRELKKAVPPRTEVFAISAKARDNLDNLLFTAQKLVEKQRKAEARKAKKELPVITLADDENTWQVVKTGKSFVVSGTKIERFAARTDFDNPDAVQRLRDIMKKMGIEKELIRQGVEPGRQIKIGSINQTIEY